MFSESFVALFVIVALGLILGKVSLRGISLGSSAIILVAMVFGHFGVQISPEFQKLGLPVFIFTIGIQAGPSFFQSFAHKGKLLAALGVLLISLAALTTVAIHWLAGIDIRIAVGLMAGALTSSSGLAAAIESSQSPLASIGYGIAYPFGIFGVILFAKLAPRLFRIDLARAEADFEAQSKASHPELQSLQLQVTNPNIFGKSLAQLKLRNLTQANVSRVKKGDKILLSSPEIVLQENDIIKVIGTPEALEQTTLLIGQPSTEDLNLNSGVQVEWVLVSNKEVVGKTIGQLNLQQNYNANITRILRSGVQLSPRANSEIRYGDRLLIATEGYKENIVRLFGNDIKKLTETDFLPIALGVIIGVLVGEIPITLPGGIHFKLGLTGGVLLTALLLSWRGKTGPIVWSLSGSGNQLLRQFGLMLFLAPVGTAAGATLADAFAQQGWGLFALGALITLVPMFVTAFIGLYVLRINPLTVMGLIMGGMTSTPGLNAVESSTKTDAPQLAYATVYPIAMVLLIIFTQLLTLI